MEDEELEAREPGYEYEEQPVVPPRTFKPTAAGIMLVCVFIMGMYVMGMLCVNAMRAPELSGEAPLRGIIRDTRGVPLEGVNVSVVGTGLYAFTNATGRYEIPGVPAGMQKIKFYKEGYRVVVITTILYPIEDLKANDRDANTINLPTRYTDLPSGIMVGGLEGPYVDAEHNPLQSGNISGLVINTTGAPVANATLNLTGPYGFNLTTQSGEYGNYTILDIPPGKYVINVSKENHTSAVYEILLLSGENKTINLTLSETTYNATGTDVAAVVMKQLEKLTLYGRVEDINGIPIANANVSIIEDDLYVWTSTNETGMFALRDVVVGIYDIKVSCENYRVVLQDNVTILPDEDDNKIMYLEFVLSRAPGAKYIGLDLSMYYTCATLLAIFSILALAGGICALKRRHYGIALIGAIFGILPVMKLGIPPICTNAVLSVVALVLIITSRAEFQ
jgi:hypothetical protein